MEEAFVASAWRSNYQFAPLIPNLKWPIFFCVLFNRGALSYLRNFFPVVLCNETCTLSSTFEAYGYCSIEEKAREIHQHLALKWLKYLINMYSRTCCISKTLHTHYDNQFKAMFVKYKHASRTYYLLYWYGIVYLVIT